MKRNFSENNSLMIKIIFGLIIAIGIYAFVKDPIVEQMTGADTLKIYELSKKWISPGNEYNKALLDLRNYVNNTMKDDKNELTVKIRMIVNSNPNQLLSVLFLLSKDIKDVIPVQQQTAPPAATL